MNRSKLFKNYSFNRICSCCNCREDGLILPLDVSLDAPVKSENCHQEKDDAPEDFSEHSLIRKEDVDQTLPVL